MYFLCSFLWWLIQSPCEKKFVYKLARSKNKSLYIIREEKPKHKLSNSIRTIFLFSLWELQRFIFLISLQTNKISKRCPLHVLCLSKRKQIPFTVPITAADLYNVVINLMRCRFRLAISDAQLWLRKKISDPGKRTNFIQFSVFAKSGT